MEESVASLPGAWGQCWAARDEAAVPGGWGVRVRVAAARQQQWHRSAVASALSNLSYTLILRFQT